jgi:glycosyltransferase involved in cell wall biosynthesis
MPLKSSENLMRVGYLLSKYPAVSHTFFLKEILGMRQRGFQIQVASVNLSDRSHQDLSSIEKIESANTFYIKGRSVPAAVLQVLGIALRHPRVALRGLAYAIRLGNWGLKTQAYACFYLAEALLVGNWMRRHGLQRLHVHFGGPVASVGLMTAKAWQIPLSLTLHGPDEFFDQDASYLAQKIETADFVICISDFCRSQVMRIAPAVDESRLEVARLGVEIANLHPRQLDSRSGPLRLVCTGRMVAAKGHRILIHAVAAMIASDFAVSLTLIGDGPERPALEALAAKLGISSHIRFLGSMTHQATLDEVALADVFVLASFAEGLPVALMEAMALSVPCVSTPIAAIPELIQDGRNGLLVPPANTQALQSALEKLAQNPELRRQLGVAARATAESQYDLGRNLDKLASLWRRRLGETAESNP